mmetsp:Transcript_15307/g.41143  ORF Transcript_15307/g.41143 Transcript_15307/m.41143 type:complete len:224 (+) Transcript_15307:2084-2755(+)
MRPNSLGAHSNGMLVLAATDLFCFCVECALLSCSKLGGTNPFGTSVTRPPLMGSTAVLGRSTSVFELLRSAVSFFSRTASRELTAILRFVAAVCFFPVALSASFLLTDVVAMAARVRSAILRFVSSLCCLPLFQGTLPLFAAAIFCFDSTECFFPNQVAFFRFLLNCSPLSSSISSSKPPLCVSILSFLAKATVLCFLRSRSRRSIPFGCIKIALTAAQLCVA